jgi:hypothetical protein
VLEKNVVPGGVFFGAYPKPLPYFFPFVEVIERAIKMMGRKHYTARILIDGIDRQKAREITNALRLRDVCLETVKGRRDESEPLIRLADMWAGCVRAAALGSREEEELLDRALRLQRVQCVTELPQKRKTP